MNIMLVIFTSKNNFLFLLPNFQPFAPHKCAECSVHMDSRPMPTAASYVSATTAHQSCAPCSARTGSRRTITAATPACATNAHRYDAGWDVPGDSSWMTTAVRSVNVTTRQVCRRHSLGRQGDLISMSVYLSVCQSFCLLVCLIYYFNRIKKFDWDRGKGLIKVFVFLFFLGYLSYCLSWCFT